MKIKLINTVTKTGIKAPVVQPGLGCGPVEPETRVRIPAGAPRIQPLNNLTYYVGFQLIPHFINAFDYRFHSNTQFLLSKPILYGSEYV